MLLYKYFPDDRSTFLDQCLVRFTPANDFNDLFEGRGQYAWLVKPDQAVAETDTQFDSLYDQALLDVYDKLPTNLRESLTREQIKNLLLSSNQTDELREGLKTYIASSVDKVTPLTKDELYTQFCSRLGIFCLSENPLSNPMWGYYTNHKGFVVGFDADHKFFNKARDAEGFLGKLHKVRYMDNLPRHDTIATMSAEDMFLTKKSEWQHEAEWRMLDGLHYADKVMPGDSSIYLFRVPSEAIREVIFGFRSNESLRHALTEAVNSKPDLRHVIFKSVHLDVDNTSLDLYDL